VAIFFVQDKSGQYYPATFLADANGNKIVDTVLAGNLSPHSSNDLTLYADQAGTVMPNPGNYLVVPSADFMNTIYNRGQAYGGLLSVDPDSANNLLLTTFAPKVGHGDAQYQSDYGALRDSLLRKADYFIPAFTDAGNFAAGIFGQGANSASNGKFSSNDLLQIFGAANRHLGGRNKSAPLGNSPWGYEAINHGYDFMAGNNRTSATSFDPNDLTPAFSASSVAPGNGSANSSRLNTQNGQMAFPLPATPEGLPGTAENWQAHFGQFPDDSVPRVLGQNTYVPWYASPAVRGNFAPAGGPGDGKSPVKPELEKKGSEAPDFSSAPTTAQAAGPTTPALQRDAAYSPPGGVFGNFPRSTVTAPAPLPTASNGSGSNSGQWTIADAIAQLKRVGQGVGNGLISPAEAASAPQSPWPSPTASNSLSATPMESQSAGPNDPFSGGLPGRLAAYMGGTMNQAQMPPSEANGISSGKSSSGMDWVSGDSGQPTPQWTGPLPLADLFGISKAARDNDWLNLPAFPSQVPQQPEPPQQATETKPVRLLGRRILNPAPAPAFAPGSDAAPLAPSGDPTFSPDDDQEQADIRALDARLSSLGNIRDAVALYNALRSRWG